MKERLTSRAFGGVTPMLKDKIYYDYPIADAIEKLADYEDAEEAGLLVRLPCKVGDAVYYFSPISDELYEDTVYILAFIKGEKELRIKTDYYQRLFFESDIGKTLFFTREEAEKRANGDEQCHKEDR